MISLFGHVLVSAVVAQATFPDLVHRWRGDGDAADAAGGSEGILHGPVSYGPGRHGQAFELGAGAWIDFGPRPGSFGSLDFTISFWCRLERPMQATLLSKRWTCTPVDMFEIRSKVDGDVAIDIAGAKGASASSLVTRKAGLDDGAWHHLAWRREDGAQSVFIDGCVLVTPVGGDVADLTTSAPLALGVGPCTGATDGTTPFIGAFDEIQIYGRALGDAEIRVLAGSGILGDIDADTDVDGADLGFLLNGWGACGSCCPADLDGDGVVGPIDLGLLLAAWS